VSRACDSLTRGDRGWYKARSCRCDWCLILVDFAQSGVWLLQDDEDDEAFVSSFDRNGDHRRGQFSASIGES
jgi:hypothetical protein